MLGFGSSVFRTKWNEIIKVGKCFYVKKAIFPSIASSKCFDWEIRVDNFDNSSIFLRWLIVILRYAKKSSAMKSIRFYCVLFWKNSKQIWQSCQLRWCPSKSCIHENCWWLLLSPSSYNLLLNLEEMCPEINWVFCLSAWQEPIAKNLALFRW